MFSVKFPGSCAEDLSPGSPSPLLDVAISSISRAPEVEFLNVRNKEADAIGSSSLLLLLKNGIDVFGMVTVGRSWWPSSAGFGYCDIVFHALPGFLVLIS